MGTYKHINQLAKAIATDPDLQAYCVEKYARGLLVQVDENPAKGLTSDDCPWCCLVKWPDTQLGPVIDLKVRPVLVACGVCQKDSTEATPDVDIPRTAEASGMQHYGKPEEAEHLLELIYKVIEKVVLDDDYLLYNAHEDSNGWMQLPMQTASMIINIKKAETF